MLNTAVTVSYTTFSIGFFYTLNLDEDGSFIIISILDGWRGDQKKMNSWLDAIMFGVDY